MYIQANIGRNVEVEVTTEGRGVVGTRVEPMGDTAWKMFQEDVRDDIMIAIYATHPDLPGLGLRSQFQFHTGEGEWDGVKEESAHVSIYFDAKPGQVNAARVHEHLADRLADTAREHGQDAIAFLIADSALAFATTD